jgi:TetR/AcrR family transcriptional regulator, cholesterol catabolism regulator
MHGTGVHANKRPKGIPRQALLERGSMKQTKKNGDSDKSNGLKSRSFKQDTINKRQQHIVKKASKLFIKKGYSKTTMRDISKATDINLGNLYNFINSKEDILCIAFDTYHDPAMEWFKREGVLDIEDPKEQLRVAVRQMLEMIHHSMNDVLMMYRETRVLPPKFRKTVLSKESDLIRIFENIIARGVEKKIFSVKDPFFAANMLVFQLSLYPLRNWNLKRYTREEFLDLAEESMLKAIIPKPM